MAPARRTPRSSTSAFGSSSPITPTNVIYAESSLPSTLTTASRNARRQMLATAKGSGSNASTLPSKLHEASSYDNPIVLSDTETNTDSVGDIEILDSFSSDMAAPHGLPATASTTAAQALLQRSNSYTANNQDESRSSTTVDRSYATSLNSDLHAVSDGSLSSLSSVDSDSDAADGAHEKSRAITDSPSRPARLKRHRELTTTPSRDSEAASDANDFSSSRTPTPSRRSARIVSSGSSVQKALQRRDELDAKLLATPVRRKADSPEAPPAKRPRGRPRKSAPVAGLPQSSTPSLATTVQSTPGPSSARRSNRLSMPVIPQAAVAQVTASPQSPKAKQSPPEESDREPRRSRRSRGIEAVVERQDDAKLSPTPTPSSSASISRDGSKAMTSRAGASSSLAGSSASQDVPVLPVKRGPGRPRKYPLAVPPPQAAPASPVAEKKEPTMTDRLRKRSSPSVSASEVPPVKQDSQESPRRKRGRPRRIVESATSDSAPGSPAASQLSAILASPTSRRRAIDLLEDDSSELSDASDVSVDSSLPSRLAKAARAKKVKRASKHDKDGKAYHFVGLYAGEADAVASTSSRRPAETPNTVFPTPIHFGDKLLTEERDFCLPYPIHQSKEQLRDKVNAKRKPPRYLQISKNKYVTRAKLQGEVPLCNCPPGSGCGADCINRMLMFICDPKTCPSASNCTNVSLGRRPNVKTTVAYYGRRGFGLKTLEPIKKDEFIDEYRGEVINLTEVSKRVTEEYKATGNFYFLDYDSAAGEVLDGGRKGNITRFANHSCDPNCRIEKFIICGTDEALSAEFQIGLFANRDIAEGEELTYNYGWAYFQPRDITGAPTAQVPTQQCLCGAANCLGTLGAKKAPVAKAVVDAVKANSRAKTAKGRGKGKGKARKAGQGSRVRMRSMTPMLNASRLSAAAMPSSALLSGTTAKSSRKSEKAQATLNLLDKIVIRRRERSARAAGESSSSKPASTTDISMGPMQKQTLEGEPKTRATATKAESGTNHSQLSSANISKTVAPSLSAPVAEAASAPATSIALSEALSTANANGPKAASTSQATASNGQENVDPAVANAGATSKAVPRLPLLKKLAAKKKTSAFGRAATAARGTKDRRWSAAEALMSDNDETSSIDNDNREMSDSDESVSKTPDGDKKRRRATTDGTRRPGRRGRRKLELSGEDAQRRAAERRARNAFLARVRRASKRGIVIEDPTQHPLKKISIECTAAPDNTYIPDLPSSLVTLGMTTADARRARNAFLARVRRAMKRGYVKEAAIKMAAKPLPGDPERDTPVMRAQRAYMERIEREAADELTGPAQGSGAAQTGSGSRAAATDGDQSWFDESSWAAH